MQLCFCCIRACGPPICSPNRSTRAVRLWAPRLSITSDPAPEGWCRPRDIWPGSAAGCRRTGVRSGSELVWHRAAVRRRPVFIWILQNTLAAPRRWRSQLRRAIRPGLMGCGSRTSAWGATGFSSTQFTGWRSDSGFLYRASTSSIQAMHSLFRSARRHFISRRGFSSWLSSRLRATHQAMIRRRRPTSCAVFSGSRFFVPRRLRPVHFITPGYNWRRLRSYACIGRDLRRRLFLIELRRIDARRNARVDSRLVPGPFSASRQPVAGPSSPTGHAPKGSFACRHYAAPPFAERGAPSVRLYTAIALEN